MRFRQALPWLITVLLAIAVLALVTVWVSADGINRGEALKTGGLAAGSVVALYALWLNDRRRRTEEQRQEIERRRQELDSERYALEQRRQDLEHQRAEHDRERVADERFARAVELLGHSADQVRVGALHALAGLASSRPAYTQTVLDVLCSYLRRPFDHPRFFTIRGGKLDSETAEWRKKREESDRWLQVRLTAQRIIADLLPPASDVDAPRYDLDLEGATLEYFDISNRVVGQIRARRANLYESTSLKGTVVHGPVWFTGATCWGRLYAQGARFHDRAWFTSLEAHGVVDFRRADFRDDTKFAELTCRGGVSFWEARFVGKVNLTKAHFREALDLRVVGELSAVTQGMTVSLEHEVHLPEEWVVDRTRGANVGLVRNPAAGVT